MKPGYKQTEVGVIPDEWDATSFDQTLKRQNAKAFQIQTSSYQTNGLLPVVDQGQKAVVGYCDQNDRRFECPEGGVIVFGDHTCIVKFVDFDFVVGADGTQLLTAKVGNCTRFHFYALEHKGVLTTGYNRHFKFLRERPFVRPPLPEQRAIATALSDVDGLLGGLDRLIAKKRDLKQAAMQQLLTGQTRLPGWDGAWEVKTLFELAARKKELFDDGDWIESEHITTEGIRLIQTGNIGVGSFVEKDDKKYINEASFTSLRCKQLKQGDLLVCRLADPPGRACVLGDIGEERIVTSVDVTIFRPPTELADRLFLSQVFSTSNWFRSVSDRSGGTTHKRISRGALGRLSIKLPPLPEQTAIAEVLTEMDAELAVLEQRREKTRALKQAMMQELLTGKTRLFSPQKTAA